MLRVLSGRTAALTASLAVAVAACLTACTTTGAPSTSTTTTSAGGSGSLGDEGGTAGGGALDIAGVSVIVDRKTLLLPDGKAIGLDKIDGGGLSGFQTRDGFLIRGYGNGVDTLSLWLVTPDATMRKLVDKAEAPVAVAADGRHIAWRSAGRLYYGQIDPTSGVKVDKTGAAPARGAPVSLAVDAVVLGYSETGGGIDHYDPWIPSLGEYKPTWDKTVGVFAVYDQGRGSSFLGLVQGPAGGKDTCIADMDPRNNLKATKMACGLRLVADRVAAVSPDGHWLAVQSADDSGKAEIDVYDLSTLFTKPAVAARWSGTGVGAWEDSTAMLVPGHDPSGGLIRYRVGSSTGEPVDRPGLSKDARIDLLPRLG